MTLVNQFISFSTHSIVTLGPIFGMLLLILEGLFPPLPLNVLVVLNVNSFGLIVGILVSWIGTVLGSICMYKICEKLFYKFIYNHLKDKSKKIIDKGIKRYNKITLPVFVIIEAIPFAPTFFINLISGISDLPFKKYVVGITIGKFFLIIYWGLLANSLIGNLNNIKSILIIIIILIVVYLLCKILSKKFRIK